VLDPLKNLNLSPDALNVVHLLDATLLQDLNCYFSMCLLMLAESDLAKSSFAKRFAKLVFTNNFGCFPLLARALPPLHFRAFIRLFNRLKSTCSVALMALVAREKVLCQRHWRERVRCREEISARHCHRCLWLFPLCNSIFKQDILSVPECRGNLFS
jgi:hypothetical protein